MLMLFCSAISALWGYYLQQLSPGGMPDFRAIYYGSRCLIHGRDPYVPSEFLRVYEEDGGEFPTKPDWLRNFRRAVPYCINLPTTLLFSIPLALLPWGTAHIIWLFILLACLTTGAFLVWDIASDCAPRLSLLFVCALLVNCEVLFELGNAAGIAVGLSAVAIWCFFRERYALSGVLCLAIALAVKPQDVALIWLYFLLAGGVFRKRAFQTLAVTGALSLLAIVWFSHSAPHWVHELQANLAATSGRGDLNDPGPASIGNTGLGMMISLQTVISVLKDDPRLYNPLTYLLLAPLLLYWAITTLRARFSAHRAWLAIAAIVALSMLPIYHRQYDAKILLLTIPACAMLWARGGVIRWLALLMTTVGFVFTADLPLAMLRIITDKLQSPPATTSAKMMTIVFGRPAALSLLGLAIFYLWIYARRLSEPSDIGNDVNQGRIMDGLGSATSV